MENEKRVFSDVWFGGINFKIEAMEEPRDLSKQIDAPLGTLMMTHVIRGLEVPVYLILHDKENWFQFVYAAAILSQEIMFVNLEDEETVVLLTNMLNFSGVLGGEDD